MNAQGWLPAFVQWRDGAPRVQWVLLREERLLEPFYNDTMRRVMRHPFHRLFRQETTMEEMVEWTEANPGLEPRGFLFHMSRCGSTLLAQMLAASDKNVVASEPPPLDSVLQAPLHLPELQREVHLTWIRAMVRALAQPRGGNETAFYLKLDCWHTHSIALLRDAFPQVPWIFLYRDPVEVLASHHQIPAMWTIPSMMDPRALHLQLGDWEPAQHDLYRARALANICAAGCKAAKDGSGLLVNYTELPHAMEHRLIQHLQIDPKDLPPMLERSRKSAKSPGTHFTSDTAQKQAEATEATRAAAARYLSPIYTELESVRLEQLAGVSR